MTGDERRQALIDEMFPVATGLVESVHDLDLPATWGAITGLFDAGDRDRVAAVLVALAAMVDPDATLGDLLAWVSGEPRQREQIPYGDLSATRGEKRCTGCKRILPAHKFGADRSRKDGLTYRCRECLAARRRRPVGGKRAADRQRVFSLLLAQGETVEEAGRLAGVTPRTAARYARRLRRAAA